MATLVKTQLEVIDLEVDKGESNKNESVTMAVERKIKDGVVNLDETHQQEQQEMKAEDTEHMKVYNEILNFYSILGKLYGSEIKYDWKPRNHLLFWVTNLLVLIANFHVPYTQYLHYASGDYMKIIEPCAALGLISSCTLKWFSYVKYYPKIFSLIFCAKKLCQENIVGSRADILFSGLSRAWTVLKTYSVGVALCLTFYVVIPLKLYIFDNILTPLTPLEVIFCDQSTASGFLTANFTMVICGMYGGLATIMYGSAMIICICNYKLQGDLIGQDFKDLDDMWSGTSSVGLASKHAFLIDIFRKRQDMNNYLLILKEMYELKLLIYFCISFFSQIVCLYEITENDWVTGYSFLIILLIELMSYCVIGTQISICDDQLCDIVYCSSWYNYDLKSQKLIVLMLHECQQCKDMQLGPLGPLNVITGIQILKSIYSYYTVLTELL